MSATESPNRAAETAADQRAAYVRYLTLRLEARAGFVDEAEASRMAVQDDGANAGIGRDPKAGRR